LQRGGRLCGELLEFVDEQSAFGVELLVLAGEAGKEGFVDMGWFGLWFSGGGVNSDGLWDSLGLLLDGGQGRGWDVVVGGNGRLLLAGNSGGWSWSWGDLEVDDQWRIDVVGVVGRGVLFLDVFVADWRLVFDFADEDFGRAGLCFGGGFDGSSRGGSSLFRCNSWSSLLLNWSLDCRLFLFRLLLLVLAETTTNTLAGIPNSCAKGWFRVNSTSNWSSCVCSSG
jgi:hypothetical protein